MTWTNLSAVSVGALATEVATIENRNVVVKFIQKMGACCANHSTTNHGDIVTISAHFQLDIPGNSKKYCQDVSIPRHISPNSNFPSIIRWARFPYHLRPA
jgi:hypothetical protein